jgi:hypothetical protein
MFRGDPSPLVGVDAKMSRNEAPKKSQRANFVYNAPASFRVEADLFGSEPADLLASRKGRQAAAGSHLRRRPGLLASTAGHHRRESNSWQVYALTSSQSLHETLDPFLTREAAEAELREILGDEPDWKNVLRVVPIELDLRHVSEN